MPLLWCYFLQQGIVQSSIGQGRSQQASVALAAEAEGAWQQEASPVLTKENAMPAESMIAAPSASALFFMMKFQFKKLFNKNGLVCFLQTKQTPQPDWVCRKMRAGRS